MPADAPYREERLRLRYRLAVFKGWTAWNVREYPAALAAFDTALDFPCQDPGLSVWMVRHLVERQSDYLEPPQNGAWPERSLCAQAGSPEVLVEPNIPARPPAPSAASYQESTIAALDLLHRLILAQPSEMRHAANLYFAYHPLVEPATRMVLAPISAGSFLMGSPQDEPDRFADEGPQHQVTLSSSFWMGIHPVTQRQYEAITGSNPSNFKTSPDLPVENVSWDEAVAFCEKLTERARTAGILPDGYVFRLPTEAEWEYCCRAGTDTATAFGASLSSEQANFDGNYPYGGAPNGPYLNRTSEVGSYPPNAWGLYDMHGNVWEWCADWLGPYSAETATNPAGPPQGRTRVCRGGGWRFHGRDCRSASRYAYGPGDRLDYLGFRVCLARSPAGAEPRE